MPDARDRNGALRRRRPVGRRASSGCRTARGSSSSSRTAATVGSRSSLADAIAAAQRANVDRLRDRGRRRGPTRSRSPTLASATGGRLFDADDTTSLGATYRALGRELDRTWQLSYLSRARPGRPDHADRARRRAAATTSAADPGRGRAAASSTPSPTRSRAARSRPPSVVLLVALLLAGAGAAGRGRRRAAEIGRLLEPHVSARELVDGGAGDRRPALRVPARLDRALARRPARARTRLTRTLERSGVKLRRGHLPYLAALRRVRPRRGRLGARRTAAARAPADARRPGRALRRAADRRAPADEGVRPAAAGRAGDDRLDAARGTRAPDRAQGRSPTTARPRVGGVRARPRRGAARPPARPRRSTRCASGSARRDLEYVATAINVQSQTGGSLAGLFDTLSETVRERQRHARKVHALTALGRSSAIILVGLPIGLGGLMTLISPSYMTPLYTTSTGHLVIGICLTSMAIGGPVPQANRLGEVLDDDPPSPRRHRLPRARPPSSSPGRAVAADRERRAALATVRSLTAAKPTAPETRRAVRRCSRPSPRCSCACT